MGEVAIGSGASLRKLKLGHYLLKERQREVCTQSDLVTNESKVKDPELLLS